MNNTGMKYLWILLFLVACSQQAQVNFIEQPNVIVTPSIDEPEIEEDLFEPEREYLQQDKSLTEKQMKTINVKFKDGGPPKDGIPSIDEPKWINLSEVKYADNEVVYGVLYDDVPKVIPASILFWHEVVNEEVDGEKYSVTLCPLTGTAIGYLGHELGVSGSLYNSNLVLYDRQSDADIPQIHGIAVNERLAGESLDKFRVYQTTWKQWKRKYPNSLVLSQDTGSDRDYGRKPYPGYELMSRLFFPVDHESDLFHRKEIVHGIEYKGKYMAIPLKEFKKKGRDVIKFNGAEIDVVYDRELDTIVASKNGVKLPSFDSYWFAWYTFHPDTRIWGQE